MAEFGILDIRMGVGLILRGGFRVLGLLIGIVLIGVVWVLIVGMACNVVVWVCRYV